MEKLSVENWNFFLRPRSMRGGKLGGRDETTSDEGGVAFVINHEHRLFNDRHTSQWLSAVTFLCLACSFPNTFQKSCFLEKINILKLSQKSTIFLGGGKKSIISFASNRNVYVWHSFLSTTFHLQSLEPLKIQWIFHVSILTSLSFGSPC